LRSSVVFTVHDVLADPPFARLDFVSCRNLLIYLLPEAQAKVISIIHFALREGGLLLVGDAETVGVADGRFAVISKPQRIYRRVGGARPDDFGLSSSAGDGSRLRARPGPSAAPSRQIELAELCRRMVLEAYGPAAVLINRKLECLYFQGPVDRYLKVVSGRPVNDVIAMAREGVRTKLRSAVQRAMRENTRVVMPGGRTNGGAGPSSFSIVVIPAPPGREDLFLACFVEEPKPQVAGAAAWRPLTFLGSSSSNGNSRRQELNCRAPSATSRSQAKSRWRSTRRRCPSTRNINRRTRNCLRPRRSFNRSTRN